MEQVQNVPHTRFQRHSVALDACLQSPGDPDNKFLPVEGRAVIFHALEHGGAVQTDKIQIFLGGAGEIHFPAHVPPDLVHQRLGVEEGAVGIEDYCVEVQSTHTLPMSVRLCMSVQVMGSQAA